jgi:hypothetical protein
MHLGRWGITSWVGAVRLSVEYRCALFAPRPVALALVPASASVGVGDYAVSVAVAVSGHDSDGPFEHGGLGCGEAGHAAALARCS